MHVFASFGAGGVPIRIANVLNGLEARYRHTIVTLDGVDAARDRLDRELDVTVIDPAIDKRRPFAAVRRIRESKGLSQEGLSHACGLHRTYVGSIERGERNVALHNITRLAGSLGLTAAELLAEAEL